MQILPSAVQRLLVKLPADLRSADLFRPGTATGALVRSAAIVADDAGTFAGSGLGQGVTGFQWQPVTPMQAARALHPWDAAHALVQRTATELGRGVYAEPDYLQQPLLPQPDLSAAAVAGGGCAESSYNPDWGPTDHLTFGWHLGTDYSQLKAARDAVGDRLTTGGWRVRIGHLDTGYDPSHISLPIRLRADMAWNFVDNNNNAVAPTSAGGLLPDPSHGIGTLGLLAGKQIPQMGNDFLGGAPYADIVPVRVGNTWLHLGTGALAGGIDHAVGCGCNVISISAGGLPAQSWADAVNHAYDKGCCIFAASGDSLGGLPTHLTVYPARFKRVVSVCGVTHEGQPYYRDDYGFSRRLEGNWGPSSAMATAISAYAPNVPWAKQGCGTKFDADGSGTSAATPQAAAAAALWLQMHLDQMTGAQPWQKVEAVRIALFNTARPGDGERLGHGSLRAMDALGVAYDPARLPQAPQPPDNIDFALLKELFGLNVFGVATLADAATGTLSPERQHMLEVEAAQLVQSVPQLAQIVGDADIATAQFPPNVRRELVTAMRTSPAASQTLRQFLDAAAARI
jgi:hypothetical protein